MSRRLIGIALVASLAVLSGTAHAKGLKLFHQTGAWESLAGINDLGKPQCVTLTTASTGGDTGAIMLKFSTIDPKVLIVDLSKASWKIPNGVSMRIRLQVDNAPGRIYEANGVSQDMVGFGISLDKTDPVTGEPAMQLLINLLTNGQRLNATFPDGNEAPWQASLNGSGTELEQFGTCIHTIKVAENPTQPFSSSGTSPQPFRSRKPEIPLENDEGIRKVNEPYLKMIQ